MTFTVRPYHGPVTRINQPRRKSKKSDSSWPYGATVARTCDSGQPRRSNPNPRLTRPEAARGRRQRRRTPEQPGGRPTAGVRRGAESEFGGERAKTTPTGAQQTTGRQLRTPADQCLARDGACEGTCNGVELLLENGGRALSARPHAARAWCAKPGWAARTPSIPPRGARWSARRHTAAAASRSCYGSCVRPRAPAAGGTS